MRPFISCIMPTANRRRFVKKALEYFMRQTYVERELVIIDDGDDSVGDLIDGPLLDFVTYSVVNKKLTIGEKRNLACEAARGDIIAHFDDDDWQHPDRLQIQIACLHGYDLTGLDTQLYYRITDNSAWRYKFPQSSPLYAMGNSFMYTRDCWEKRRFFPLDNGEDTRFIWDVPRIKVHPTGGHFVVGIEHGSNVSQRELVEPYWQPQSLDSVKHLLRDDFEFYKS